MFNRRSILLSFCYYGAAALLAAQLVQAAEPHKVMITVQGMHCAGCAAKVTRKLQAVPGVKSSQVDPTKDIALVTPKKAATLSPYALWDAVEKAGYKPTKLVGPGGTITSKPKLQSSQPLQ